MNKINDIKKGITNQLRHSFVTSQAENKKYQNIGQNKNIRNGQDKNIRTDDRIKTSEQGTE